MRFFKVKLLWKFYKNLLLHIKLSETCACYLKLSSFIYEMRSFNIQYEIVTANENGMLF